MVCTACAADVPDDDVFCENCGVKLDPAETVGPTCTCGAAQDEVDEDGFCLRCGRRVRRPASDHIEESFSPDFAAVSDRGLRHDRNEDRFAIVQAERGAGLVVCDGVSATNNAEVASEIVTQAVANAFGEALGGAEAVDAEHLITQAIAQAGAELRSRTGQESGDAAPSTTLVAALVLGAEITVGWVGDSRAYWIGVEDTRLLTRDHSWMNMVLESGQMTEAEAQASPQAHAITRWLGADAEDASTPEFVHYTFHAGGTLLLCTDGLWNYASAPERISELLKTTDNGQSRDALAAARALVSFANEQGGRDNITVAVLHVQPPDRA